MSCSAETIVFQRPESMQDKQTHYCPGCLHGVSHRLVAEALDEMDLRERAVGIAPVGCSVLAYNYMNCDFQEAAHGRAPALATGVKRGLPDSIVFTYQGDGDLASIGTAEVIHAANRGEKITVVFINNAIYGMTGGQMAPTTLVGQKTTTSPYGRDPATAGHPLRVAEMIATLAAPVYVTRQAMFSPPHIIKAKKAVKKAFKLQNEGAGFTFVEILSNCPTGWGLTPEASLEWGKENMVPYFPLGDLKVPEGGAK
jgi:2-oxoglutarate ferredoxin oxidoreductase subunit beta